jgi:hypothetical protein
MLNPDSPEGLKLSGGFDPLIQPADFPTKYSDNFPKQVLSGFLSQKTRYIEHCGPLTSPVSASSML